MKQKSYTKQFSILSVLLILFFLCNISLGSVYIPLQEIVSVLTGNISVKESWTTIIINFRLPKAITAILVW